MKKSIINVFIIIFLTPFLLKADITYVDERKSDIFFANGILNTRKDARQSLQLIEKEVLANIYNNDKSIQRQETDYKLLYNNTSGILNVLNI